MPQFPEWLKSYVDSLPRHPVDYCETSERPQTMTDWLDRAWNYSPFDSLLGGKQTKNANQNQNHKPQEGNNVTTKQDQKPEQRKPTAKPTGAGSAVVPRSKPVERIIEKHYYHGSSDNQSGSGGSPAKTPGKKEGASEGEQEHQEAGDDNG